MTPNSLSQLSFPSIGVQFKKAKPILKWAGGKTQLLAQFRDLYPQELKTGEITTYVEPFVGGAAVFFDIVQTYPVKKAFLYDINAELILLYKVVQQHVQELIEELAIYASRYQKLDDEGRKTFYYDTRTHLNKQRVQIDFDRFSTAWISRAARIVFLNRTCFNGLFRLNSRGEFNVPHGKYRNPKILDVENLLNVSRILQMTEIRRGDFELCEDAVNPQTFVYFDPPYRPISKTASFTAYSKHRFGDEEQIRLAHFFACLDRETGAKLMLSNSDPTNENPEDTFFDDLYRDFRIHRVSAQRMINSNGLKRGPIRELLITNYGVPV